MLPLTEKELKSEQDSVSVTFLERNSHNNLLKIKIIEKLEIIVTLQVNTEAQHTVSVT